MKGSWGDIAKFGKKYDLMIDMILNHISSESLEFKDYLKNGEKSKFKNLFIPVEKIVKTEEDKKLLSKIYRPRPQKPYFSFKFGDNTRKDIWCTFSKHHIDVDWNISETKELFKRILLKFLNNGCNLVRLDAVGYIFKKLGTNSFFIDEVYNTIKWLKEIAKDYNCSLLTEVHFTPEKQIELAKKVDLTYDFALPMLVLHALNFGENKYLYEWNKIRPKNCVTTLDTHDGIGIIDVKGLLPDKEIEKTMEKVYSVSEGSKKATGESSENLDIYQINSTFYSALGNNDKAYLASRAIQFFFEGIPQVYYVGLLCGKNDLKKLKETNVGRDINRHNYSIEEIKKEIKRSVCKNIFELMKFRNECKAFCGECKTPQKVDKKYFELSWTKGEELAILKVHLQNHNTCIQHFVNKKKVKEIKF